MRLLDGFLGVLGATGAVLAIWGLWLAGSTVFIVATGMRVEGRVERVESSRAIATDALVSFEDHRGVAQRVVVLVLRSMATDTIVPVHFRQEAPQDARVVTGFISFMAPGLFLLFGGAMAGLGFGARRAFRKSDERRAPELAADLRAPRSRTQKFVVGFLSSFALLWGTLAVFEIKDLLAFRARGVELTGILERIEVKTSTSTSKGRTTTSYTHYGFIRYERPDSGEKHEFSQSLSSEERLLYSVGTEIPLMYAAPAGGAAARVKVKGSRGIGSAMGLIAVAALVFAIAYAVWQADMTGFVAQFEEMPQSREFEALRSAISARSRAAVTATLISEFKLAVAEAERVAAAILARPSKFCVMATRSEPDGGETKIVLHPRGYKIATRRSTSRVQIVG